MARNNKSNKENIPLGKPKTGKSSKGNLFELLEGKTGNPTNAKEFDEDAHGDDEVFFKTDPEVTEEDKKIAQMRVLILNFIHRELKVNMNRTIPGGKFDRHTEIFHRGIYQDVSIDVGVHFYIAANGVMTAQAFVKPTDAEYDDEGVWGGAVWAGHAASADDALKDKATKMVGKLSQFYWTPRWNYVVKYLHERMHTFNQYGDKVPEIPDPKAPTDDVAGNDPDDNDNTEIEDEIEVFAGCSGKIIGPKGAKIQEIRGASGVKDIKMPEKDENNRPRARDLVKIKLIGTKRATKKAAVLILEVQKEWTDAPRPPRDGGNNVGGSNVGGWGASGEGADQAQSVDTAALLAGGGAWEADAAGGDSWADQAADAADDSAPGGSGGGW